MKKTILLTAIALITLAGSKQCNAQWWSLTGNAGVSGNFLGTTNSTSLNLRTKNLNRITITSGGNVGIGTTSPTSKLDMNGQVTIDQKNFGGYGGLLIKGNAPGSNYPNIGFSVKNNASTPADVIAGFIQGVITNKTAGSESMDLGLYTSQTGVAGLASRIYIKDNGYVGVGTETPGFNLDVSGDARFNGVRVGKGSANGIHNIALGSDALSSNTFGDFNYALGSSALQANTTGDHNTAVGDALPSNLNGFGNTALGAAMYSNVNGGYNVGIGLDALYSNVNGSNNTAVGTLALSDALSITGNSAYGYSSLATDSSGTNNTGIGTYADVSSGSLSNATTLGYQAVVNASNKVRIGNSSVSSYSCQVNWTAGSDARIKDNVQENIHGLDFINALRPVTFHYNVDKQNALIGIKNDESWEGKKDIEKIAFSGFLAQEVDAAAQKVGYDFSGIDKSGNIMGLRYSEFTVPLVKGMQELSKQNEDLKKDNADLKKDNSEMKSRLDMIEKSLSQCCSNFVPSTEKHNSVNSTDAARLEQNQPNPFNQSSVIKFYVPSTFHNAQLQITDLSGVVLKSFNINQPGSGHVTINANEFAAGSYLYSLVIDGVKSDSKKMELTK